MRPPFCLSIHRWLIAIGLVLTVVGAKLWLVDHAGSSLPYRDQIDAEGESILRPWAEERLETAAFFAPHNEHRVVWTKLLSWLGVAANGQWDVYVQVCINALLHAGLLLLLLRWLRGYVEGWRYGMLATLTAIMWLLPLDWENTLGGFQSQVYLVLGFSFLQIWGVLQSSRTDWRWWGAHLSGAMALMAMASGVLSSIAVIGVVALKVWRQRTAKPRDVANIAISGIWVAIGLLSRVSVEGHQQLRAGSWTEFLAAFAQVGSWPWQGLLPWSFVLAAPIFALTWILLRSPESSPSQRVMIGMVAWLGLTVLATAWLRGSGSPVISRYLTAYYILILLQGVALAGQSSPPWRKITFAVWWLLILGGLVGASGTALEKRLPGIADRFKAGEHVIREYLDSGDESVIRSAPREVLPYPSADVLIERWSHASIRSLLPAAVRPPLAVSPADPGIKETLPPSPYPPVAASPLANQTEPWIWRSERQPDTALPVLRFRFNGGLGDPETALRFRVVSDLAEVEVIPDGPARQRWKTINVMRPPGEWWIELEDSDTIDRIAITAPIELGWLSWGAEKLIKFHFWWFSAGTILVAAGLIGVLLRGHAPASPDYSSSPQADPLA